MTKEDNVRTLAERIHKARTTAPLCSDDCDDPDAWCHEAARIVVELGYASPETVAGILQVYEEALGDLKQRFTDLRKVVEEWESTASENVVLTMRHTTQVRAIIDRLPNIQGGDSVVDRPVPPRPEPS